MSAHTPGPWEQVFDELTDILADRLSHPQRMCAGYRDRLKNVYMIVLAERNKERGDA